MEMVHLGWRLQGTWWMERCAEGVMGKNRQNQSAPNLIFSPAGFERTGGRKGWGAASVPLPCVCVCVCFDVMYEVRHGLHTVCQLH